MIVECALVLIICCTLQMSFVMCCAVTECHMTTLKSLFYNVVMTFRFNNNNNNDDVIAFVRLILESERTAYVQKPYDPCIVRMHVWSETMIRSMW